MAGVLGHAESGEVAIANGKTLLQLVAAANHRVLVQGFGISIKGIAATDPPVLVQLLRQTDAGTMTAGTAGTHLSKKNNSDDETLQTAARVNATVEPAAGDILFSREVHPQSGEYFWFPFGQEVVVPGGGRVGVRVTSATLTYSAVASIDFQE
jgi:hypothetical protein